MGAAEVRSFLDQVQKALKVITALQLTAYLYPPHAIVNDGDSFDFIVVGAGTAGSVIANRLSRNPEVSVLLVEAGGDAPIESDLPGPLYILKRSHHDWGYDGQPDNYFGKCHLNPFFEMTLGKMMGGTSSLNYMIYDRGTPSIFNNWANIANDSTWSWKNVVPYFEKTSRLVESNCISNNDTNDYLRYMKEGGDVSKFFDAYEELGFNIEDENENKVNTYYKLRETVADGERQTSASAFLRPVKSRKNLKLLKYAVVNKILFDTNKNAVGIDVTTFDGKKIMLKATKEVIVSAGTMNSPKLLMLSGIGPKEHLKSMNIDVISDLPVGNNLQDQVSATVVYNMETLDNPLQPLNSHAYPPTSFGGFVALNASQKFSDYQTFSFVIDSKVIHTFCTFVFRYNDEICDEIFSSGIGRRQVFNQVIKINPKSKGKVMLRSANPVDPPLIFPGYFNDVEDLEDLAQYLADFAKVMNTTYFRNVNANIAIPKAVNCGELVHESTEYWKCYAQCMVSGISSFTGTCGMGSVVDGRFRVFGVQRLRVVDSSAIPSSMHNPYGTIVMMGEKVSDFITKDYSL